MFEAGGGQACFSTDLTGAQTVGIVQLPEFPEQGFCVSPGKNSSFVFAIFSAVYISPLKIALESLF